nr:Endonuclease exonuclease phosphatase domain containing protein [Haemonchus contortus]
MRQQRRRRRGCPRQYALGHEHLFVRKLNNPNRTFAIKKMWLNPSSNHLRCLRTNIELRGRGVEAFYMDLKSLYREDHTFFKVIVGDFNAKIGPRRSAEELHIGTHGTEWNEQGEKSSEFIMSTYTIHGNSQFQKPSHLRWTWESPGGQFHNEIDHIIFNRKFCLTDVTVVPKFYTGSDHRLLRARFCFSMRGERAMMFRKPSPKTSINWDHFASIASEWEDSVSTTSMKSVTGSPNIFTIALEKLRVHK